MGLLGRVSEGAMQQLCRRKMGKNLRICLRVHRTLGFLDQDHWELAQQVDDASLCLCHVFLCVCVCVSVCGCVQAQRICGSVSVCCVSVSVPVLVTVNV